MQSANKFPEPDPFTREEFLATLTASGLRKLREAQATHHAVVRERFLEGLSESQVKALAGICDSAVPGVVGSEVWPPLELRGAA